ncbi:hypothetical protein BO94DRAFT_582134 [Aspergillus sclerotioniger CBS 115572]|uniref:(S)-ureidoglycine aminohydrolase cupin domain-containing protein n=1 Tax=Aspergillus sclerotioniger CBS 115572 TaxID=1450535 RepID=A0A317X803_9EURO|nr:hypothetical protein BO94DRAFT_582134 [Aspergillus sclerotioniger CBS 115572]PWY94744.1 hypothetical protein BO94DRAFT_582134 [Aspergillus sclerotioniger CBS 115572]
MPFQIKDKTERFKLAALPGVPNVFFDDMLGTQQSDIPDPIVGAWFRMEKGTESTAPTYEYDEFGVVYEGEFNFRDETGQTATLKAGDVFFFPRGSTITFSSDSYGLAVKCRSQRYVKL